jgi:adenylylsulfate kinase-like enzyme
MKKGITIHVTGKARSGKTTIINKIEKLLKKDGIDVLTLFNGKQFSFGNGKHSQEFLDA